MNYMQRWKGIFLGVTAPMLVAQWSPSAAQEARQAAPDREEENKGVVASEGLVVDPAGVPQVRFIPRAELAGEYCVMRAVPDGSGGVSETRIPVAGVKADGDQHWRTLKPIVLFDIPHHSHCAREVTIGAHDVMDIEYRAVGNYEVTIRDTSTRTIRMQREFDRANQHGDAYLVARGAGCAMGKPGCEELDRFDAYLYLIDVRDQRERGAKIVMIDFFPAAGTPGVSAACNDERPDSSMRLRTAALGSCPIPRWLESRLGSAGWGSGAHTLETGTGGGYEPP